MYDNWIDQDAIMALAEIDRDVALAQVAPILDHPFVINLKEKCIDRFAIALGKITDRETAMRMTDEERAYTFATMEWAQFTLDILGDSTPGMIEKSIEDRVAFYAKTKLSTG